MAEFAPRVSWLASNGERAMGCSAIFSSALDRLKAKVQWNTATRNWREARMTLPTFCTHSECPRPRCCLGRRFLWTSPAWPRWYWEARDPLRLIGCAGAAAANDSTGVLQRARVAAWAICPSPGPFFSPPPAATRIRSARSHCADRPPPISRFLSTDQEKS